MDAGYAVTKRSQAGAATEIGCRTHAGCTWTMAMPGGRGDDDPIFVAMFGRHVEQRRTPERPVGGHERRKRT